MATSVSVSVSVTTGQGYPPCPACGAARPSFPGGGWPWIREACPSCGAVLWLESGTRDGGDWGPLPAMGLCCAPVGASLASSSRALAVRRVNCDPALQARLRVILYDWPGGPDGDWGTAFTWPSHDAYWQWLATAPVADIVGWAETVKH